MAGCKKTRHKSGDKDGEMTKVRSVMRSDVRVSVISTWMSDLERVMKD